MKIAFLVKLFPAMSERFVIDQIAGLLDLGLDVRIFAEYNPGDSKMHTAVQHYDLLKRTRYIPSIPVNKTIRRFKTLGLLCRGFVTHPVFTVQALYHNLKAESGFSYPALYYALTLAGRRFDILHAHFGPSGNIGVLLRKLGIGRKLVTTFHGYDVTAYTRRYGDVVYRELFRLGDVFTYNSEATRDRLRVLGCPQEKMVKLPMGIDVERIPFRARQKKAGQPVRILSVGRLVEMKGREYALRAIAQVRRQFPNIEYTIVGDGPLRESLELLIKELELNRIVHFLGWVDDDALDQLYQSCDLFLHPSVVDSAGNMEGQGLVLVEAQAYGLPVIATRHNAFCETVMDGITGFLVEERNVESLTEILGQVLTDNHKWAQLGYAGRKHAETYYDQKKLIPVLRGLYADI
ncbi:MAG: glycosyltransferase [Sedimentisphaerales bacterium]|nr:glycosyltransferase [Sedimentisphaerales bacterium]